MKQIAKYIFLTVSVFALNAEENGPKAHFQTEVVESALPRHVLSNQGIVMLSDAGYDEDFLIDVIRCKQTRFDTTVEGLTYLAKHGISERIIRFMIDNESKAAGVPIPAAFVAAPPAPSAVPAKVVRQKVLVPDLKAEPKAIATPAAVAPLQMPPTGVAAVAPYGYGPQPTPPYLMVSHHMFRNRWYLVNPYYVPAAPTTTVQGSWPVSAPLSWQVNYVPAW